MLDFLSNEGELATIAAEKLQLEVSELRWMPVTGKRFRFEKNLDYEMLVHQPSNTYSINNGLARFTDNNGNTFIGFPRGQTQEECAQLFVDLGMRSEGSNDFSVAPRDVEFHDDEEKAHWEYILQLRETEDQYHKLVELKRQGTNRIGVDVGNKIDKLLE